MPDDQSTNKKLSELKEEIDLLTKQLELVNAQLALDKAKQTQETQLANAIADALKNQVSTQFTLESEKAKLPFAELAGIKAALSDMQLPAGKAGTVQIAAGIAEKALLRSKASLFKLINEVADKLHKLLPKGAVIVTEAQLDQAYQASFMSKRIDQQTTELIAATKQAKPKAPIARPMSLVGPSVAALYSVGLILDTVNNLAKFFRIDRTVDVFGADDEALQMLGYFLEAKNPAFVANPALVREEVLDQADQLLDKLNGLLKAIHDGEDVIAQLKTIEDEEAKNKPATSRLPAVELIAELKAKIEASRSFLDGLDPAKKPEAFWLQVKGQLISHTLEDKDRLLLAAKAQVLQISESRSVLPDVIKTTGEIQLAYRILDKNGKVKGAGVILEASSPEALKFDEKPVFIFPPQQ